jgi:hypothetical protein
MVRRRGATCPSIQSSSGTHAERRVSPIANGSSPAGCGQELATSRHVTDQSALTGTAQTRSPSGIVSAPV